ncbi:MAG: alpha/beta hydrolase [Candidatus Auribacter fodinae]|jgi:pimeloyl-ACP methyl ester carboxylesterase|uniref:Alpha/beta hydrolase n=1 Tax=Candidatus Auribacter fodinae TaxID=2093366 RepID=A0A3A4QXA2_9BACT|nr:MAG: alpha/beta hydrolase [Candidatus Auribacter fodinae]
MIFKESFHFIPSGIAHIPAFIGLNGTSKNSPVVIMCHGFTGTKTEKCRHFYRIARLLIQENIIPVRFDFSGFGDSTAPSTMFSLSNAVDDIRAVLGFLRDQGIGSHSRVSILGYSLGGLIAARAAAEGIPVRSLCLMSAVEHFMLSKQEQKHLESEKSTTFWYKGYELSISFLEELLNTRGRDYIAELTIPVQLINGSDDDVVDKKHSRAYEEALNDESPDPVVIKGANHYFMQKDHQQQLDSAIINFIRATL